MPVTLVTAASSATLWRTMTSRFLDELGDHPGPDGLQSHLWIRDRYQRDLLLETAYDRGLRGWLGTPFTFWNGLAAQFDIRSRPIGLLTRRALISRLGRDAARKAGFTDPRQGRAVVRGHMLDGIRVDRRLEEGTVVGSRWRQPHLNARRGRTRAFRVRACDYCGMSGTIPMPPPVQHGG